MSLRAPACKIISLTGRASRARAKHAIYQGIFCFINCFAVHI